MGTADQGLVRFRCARRVDSVDRVEKASHHEGHHQTFGPGSGPGNWGTSDWHGTMRGWVTRRVWLEAGGGLAGVEVLRGAHVSLNVDARYTTSEFDGLKVRRISLQIALLGRQ